MFNRSLTALAAVALSGAALTAATPAFAQDEDAVFVRYSDLDLSTPAGAERFERRVHNASVSVCGTATADRDATSHARECQARAVANAKADTRVAALISRSGSRTVALRTN